LSPHPLQVAVGEDVRKRILNKVADATDVVISHFHGDHMPLMDANPYQIGLESFIQRIGTPRLWIKGILGESPRFEQRKNALLGGLNREASPCEARTYGPLSFSQPMPHGLRGNNMGTVMMTRIEEGSETFVHASDIQLLDDEPVDQILDWNPTMLLVSGPPLYRGVPKEQLAKAEKRLRNLAERVGCCIVDHHLLRCGDGAKWLNMLEAEIQGKILCAADFMNVERRFLEAQRAELYDRMPVAENWHELYSRGLVNAAEFRAIAGL